MEEIKHIHIILGVVVIVIQFIAQWVYVRFELKQLRKDSEETDKNMKELIVSGLRGIEEKRLNNVISLREIYDGKVDDSRKYAKGLFEVREGELSELNKRMTSLENKFDAQAVNLNNKFETLIKSNAFIKAHIKTCPYYGGGKKIND